MLTVDMGKVDYTRLDKDARKDGYHDTYKYIGTCDLNSCTAVVVVSDVAAAMAHIMPAPENDYAGKYERMRRETHENLGRLCDLLRSHSYNFSGPEHKIQVFIAACKDPSDAVRDSVQEIKDHVRGMWNIRPEVILYDVSTKILIVPNVGVEIDWSDGHHGSQRHHLLVGATDKGIKVWFDDDRVCGQLSREVPKDWIGMKPEKLRLPAVLPDYNSERGFVPDLGFIDPHYQVGIADYPPRNSGSSGHPLVTHDDPDLHGGNTGYRAGPAGGALVPYDDDPSYGSDHGLHSGSGHRYH